MATRYPHVKKLFGYGQTQNTPFWSKGCLSTPDALDRLGDGGRRSPPEAEAFLDIHTLTFDVR